MLDFILDIFRKRKLRKFISGVPTGFLPLDKISTVNVLIDVEEPGFDNLRDDILAWGRHHGLKVCIYFFDFRKLGKEELLLTSIQTTIIRKDLSWIKTPDIAKVGPLINEDSDLLISMIDNGDFPVEFLSKCSKARFKIGRCGFKGHPYDMVISGNAAEEMDSRTFFAAIKELLNKVR